MNGTLPLFPEGRPVSNGPASADEEHARRIVDALSAGLASSEEVFEAFAALDALDSEAVLSALRPWTGEASDPEALDDDLRRAHGFPPRRPRLRLHAIIRDADVLDLGSIAEEQLRVAGRIYDGSDLSAEDRLDGEVEGSFAGTLELRIVADESGTPLFDVYFFAGDAGVIFRAGTTELVGGINYGAVEMKDRALREAVTAALREEFVPPRVAAPAAGPSDAGAPEKVAPAKKAAAKKVAAKKVAAKAEKPAAKKVAAKPEKPVAKKVAAKPEKPVAKKVAAKKVAAETEKPAAKKVAAKKASTKKSKAAAEAAPAKKASAKKVAAKAEKPVAKSAPKKASTNPAASKKATTKTPAKAASAPAKKATTKKASSPVKKVAKSKAGAKASAKKSATKK